MPAHKRSSPEDRDGEDPSLHHHAKRFRNEPEFDEEELEDQNQLRRKEQEDDGEEEAGADEEDSEGGSSSSSGEEPTDYPLFISVELPDFRTDVQCPICLGIIKKTRTVMECLHRFCRECIDKSMRLGNNECPACRTHCASRRSLRDDPNYDALISALYPDIDKYEEQELAFHEEERNRNKQIQAVIAQISQRQTEALARRRALGKDSVGGCVIRSQPSHPNARLRGRRNRRRTEHDGSEDNEDENGNNGGKDSSSTEERSSEIRGQRYRRREHSRGPQPSSTAILDGRYIEDNLETNRRCRRVSPQLVWSQEMLAWGRGGARSNTRHNGSSNKNSRTNRISKLVNYFQSLEESNDEFDVHIMLVSLDTKSTPSLQQPYLCCRSSFSVKHLCEYIARQIPLQAEDVEIFVAKGYHNTIDDKSTVNPSPSMNDSDCTPLKVNPCKDELQILGRQETMADLKGNLSSDKDHLILAYRQKETTT